MKIIKLFTFILVDFILYLNLFCAYFFKSIIELSIKVVKIVNELMHTTCLYGFDITAKTYTFPLICYEMRDSLWKTGEDERFSLDHW